MKAKTNLKERMMMRAVMINHVDITISPPDKVWHFKNNPGQLISFPYVSTKSIFCFIHTLYELFSDFHFSSYILLYVLFSVGGCLVDF